ncbi:putative zinc metalloprotease Rip3 [subsurface metagenome]
MRSTPNLGRIFGVRVRLHYTWLAAIVLITAAVVTQFSTAYPLWQRIMLGIAASLLFFIAITIREFVLSFIATSKGTPVKRVTLFVFGGVSQIAKEDTLPSLELLLAVVGMLSNLIIAGIFYVVYIVLAHTDNIVVDVLVQWLAFIYFMLALFHFIPGFPLDGGRVLRALLWKATGNYERVTRIASWTGWAIGLIFTIGGILVLITTQQWLVGILLAFPGLVLQNAATHSRRQVG